jgi:hypothetical protein
MSPPCFFAVSSQGVLMQMKTNSRGYDRSVDLKVLCVAPCPPPLSGHLTEATPSPSGVMSSSEVRRFPERVAHSRSFLCRYVLRSR